MANHEKPRADRTDARGSLLTVTQAADRLGLARATVYRMCQGRQLAHVRVGPRRGKVLVWSDACDEHLTSIEGSASRPSVGLTDASWKHALERELRAGTKPGTKPGPK